MGMQKQRPQSTTNGIMSTVEDVLLHGLGLDHVIEEKCRNLASFPINTNLQDSIQTKIDQYLKHDSRIRRKEVSTLNQ